MLFEDNQNRSLSQEEEQITVEQFTALLGQYSSQIELVWKMLALCMILLVQITFIFFESGSVSQKTTQTVLNKSTFVFVVTAVSYYFVGFGFANQAFGGLCGTQWLFGANMTIPLVTELLHQFCLLQIFISIVTSCLIERTHLDTYLLLAIYLSSFVFPIPISWVWGDGWLAQKGVLDFAGAGVVHALSGAIGLISALKVGPRLGIFQEKLNLE